MTASMEYLARLCMEYALEQARLQAKLDRVEKLLNRNRRDMIPTAEIRAALADDGAMLHSRVEYLDPAEQEEFLELLRTAMTRPMSAEEEARSRELRLRVQP
jgi:hypothetical protein